MDAYHHPQQQQRYMRPPQPPPSTSDPHPYYPYPPHHQQQPRPPVPPQTPWYPNQFQYHPPTPPPPPLPSSHSPSPPPQQWGPPPPPPPQSDFLAPPPPPPTPAYPPPPHPYPAPYQYPPPPRPHVPPPPSQSYPQEWGNPNWNHHQTWDYPVHNNAEDWAAKARAWADAKKVTVEDQPPQSQFTQVGRPEEQNRYYEQYPPQTVDAHHPDVQQQPFPASGYQQFPNSAASLTPQPIGYSQESVSISSAQSSYAHDGHLLYPVGSGISAAASATSPSVHLQEVPSSYSSVTGKEAVGDHKEQQHKSFSFPMPIASSQEGQHHLQPSLPAYGNQTADPTTDLSNRPLDFTPGFRHDHEPHMQSSYAAHHDPSGTVRGIGASTPVNSWAPAVTTAAAYPPIPPVVPLGPQHDPSVAVPSVSGHTALQFGSFPGSSFQPTIPAAGAPYNVVAGPALAGFPGDAYGVSNVSERPKKASVPNWLKEEIIKNAPVITRPSLDHPKEETQSIEDEGVDKPFEKGDQADSKSIESSRSTEEEEDDEDYAEAARNAAINQEIKRLLTEVLLKVTDELFDEIATKVLDEDDLTVEVERTAVASNDNVSTSPLALPTPKASAKVLVPSKARESETEDVNEKSSSSSPGNILGLANYASDEDDDDETMSSISNSRKSSQVQQPSPPKLSEEVLDVAENGISQVELGKNSQEIKIKNDLSKTVPIDQDSKISVTVGNLNDHAYSSMLDSRSRVAEVGLDGGKNQQHYNGSRAEGALGENVSAKKPVTYSSQVRETRIKSDLDNRHESKRSYSGKDFIKEAESGNRADMEGDDNHRRQDEKHLRKERTDNLNGSKERKRERSDKTADKKEPESRKRSLHLDEKDSKDAEKSHRANAKEDSNKKRERTKDKEEDRARHKSTSDSGKHKRRRSSSISSRGKDNKDNDSSDEASYDSKRKLHSRKQNLSPSPVRSRRRKVSRSPHSKHSQRRHSPYSSLETTRGRRSRSKSPVRRRR